MYIFSFYLQRFGFVGQELGLIFIFFIEVDYFWIGVLWIRFYKILEQLFRQMQECKYKKIWFMIVRCLYLNGKVVVFVKIMIENVNC